MTGSRPNPTSYGSDAEAGGRWGAIRSVVLQAASILTIAVLARLLTEEDFGVVAITVMVLTAFDLLTRAGFGATLIRRPDLDERTTSTFFWASVMLGLVAAGLAIGVARPAAILAGTVEAAPLVILAAVTLPISLTAKVPAALLSRDLRFRTIAVVNILGSVTHGIVAVSLAFVGLGAASVVIGQISRAVVVFAGSMATSGFRPRWVFDGRILREDLAFSVGWFGADLAGYANRNTDYWFVGNQLGTAQLGIYYVAYVIPTILRQRVTAIGLEVLYPVVSKMQADKPRIVAAYLRVVSLVSFVVVPAMLGLAVLADLAIAIGFGSAWSAAVVPLQIIAVSAAIRSMSVAGKPIFRALGKPAVVVAIGLVSLLTLGAGLAFSLNGASLVTVALAVLLASLVEAVAIQWKMKSLVGVGYREFISSVAPFLVASLAMVALLVLLRTYVVGDSANLVQAAVLVPAGGVLYVGLGRVVFRSAFGRQLAATKSVFRPSQSG